MMEGSKLVSFLKNKDNFIILSHVRPDGDAIGASLSLYEVLKKLNKNVVILMKEVDPKFSFLNGFHVIQETLEEKDLYTNVIVLDCGEKSRLGSYSNFFDEAKETACIDHHVSTEDFARYNYKNLYVSSTCELIYQLIRMIEVELDENISNALLCGIAYDTGGFKHSNVSSTTLQIVADLVNKGAQLSNIMHEMFYKKSFSSTKLLGEALKTLELHCDNRFASLYLTKETIESLSNIPGGTDGIINVAKDIENVEVAIFLIEDNEKIKVSFRSDGKIDVSSFASKFGGGGHKKASGCTMEGNILELRNLLIQELIKLV